MKKKIIFIGILLLIVSLVGFLVLKVLYKKAERNVATENAIRIDPSNFAALFKNFEDSANKIYINKTIELTGIATSVTNNQTSQTDITVKINDSLPFINCTIDGLYKSINQLDTVTIKGICTGLLTTINLKDCIVINSKKYCKEDFGENFNNDSNNLIALISEFEAKYNEDNEDKKNNEHCIPIKFKIFLKKFIVFIDGLFNTAKPILIKNKYNEDLYKTEIKKFSENCFKYPLEEFINKISLFLSIEQTIHDEFSD